MTPEQAQAIQEIQRNLVVSAGAGAGKTYVLVQRFVNVLLQSHDARLNAVVAITFTRAAAMEMRERIRAELELRYRAGGPDSARCGDLLGQMDSARIDTIHSLCATIVRANAAEAEVDPRFEVMDATQQQLRLHEIIHNTLMLNSQDEAIGFLVAHYGLDKVEKQLHSSFSAPLTAYPPRVDDLIARWQQKPAYAALPQALLEHHAILTVAWDHVLRRIQDAYRRDKEALNVLDFDDLEKKTGELLNRYPHIRARYQGSEFKQLLVDEFQDTNSAQWDIVRALGDLQNQGTLFIVGDVKQSIYGFRRADVRVFADVKAQIEAYNGLPLKLATSFRSNPSLISLFNALFQKMLVARPQSEAHAYHVEFDHPMTVHRQDRTETPALRLLLLHKKPRQFEPYPKGWTGVKADLRRTWEGEEIARHIQALHQTTIYDRETKQHRSCTYGDVAILMRTLNEAAHYEDALERAGIPYVTFSGKGFYGLQEIYDLQNMLRVLQNNQDSLSLAAVLRSPMFGLSDETLFVLRRLRALDDEALQSHIPPPLWDQLMWVADGTLSPLLPEAEMARAVRAVNIILSLQSYTGRASSAELLRAIFAQTGYLAIVSSLPQGSQRRRNLEKLLDTAQSLATMSPAAFTHHLTRLADSGGEIREGEAAMEAEGVVKLMTVHASKGLEFPVVFLADASPFQEHKGMGGVFVTWDERGDGQLLCRTKDSKMSKSAKPEELPLPDFISYEAFVQEKEAAEELRLLYVAATRARDIFYISGEVKEDAKTGLSANGWLGTMIRTLEIQRTSDQHLFTWAGEAVQVFLPRYPAHLPDPTIKQNDAAESPTVDTAPMLRENWERLTDQAAQTLPVTPPLLAPIEVEPRKFAEHLTATQLAAFGASRMEPQKRLYRSMARRTVLYDVPGVVHAAIRTHDPRVSQRIIGEMVHEALRFERTPSRTPNLDMILTSYAWNRGLTREYDLQDAIKRARGFLVRFEQRSDVYTWIQAAKKAHMPIFMELPFLYRYEGRILHGIIDIVFQRPTGEWVIVDYKTVYVPRLKRNGILLDDLTAADYTHHSQRYYLQVGAYAAAVQQYVGATPEVYIHYLRYCKSERIPTSAWQNAIAELESVVIDVMGTGNT